MTGFGNSAHHGPELEASAWLRSLNHRYLDVTLHLPRRLLFLEPDVKAAVQRHVRRGKVELWVKVVWLTRDSESVVAVPGVVSSLVEALRAAQREHGLVGDVAVSDLARYPGAFEVVDAAQGCEAQAREVLLPLVDAALEELESMRRAEGQRLKKELEALVDAVQEAADRLDELSTASRAERQEALRERVRGLQEELGLDEGRLYQEVVRLAERSDVAEELQRLRSHAAQVRELLAAGRGVGKRLDFLAQELMREANTVGSKAASAPMIHCVVGLKGAIERLREQVQNVE